MTPTIAAKGIGIGGVPADEGAALDATALLVPLRGRTFFSSVAADPMGAALGTAALLLPLCVVSFVPLPVRLPVILMRFIEAS